MASRPYVSLPARFALFRKKTSDFSQKSHKLRGQYPPIRQGALEAKGQTMQRKKFLTITLIGAALVLGSTATAQADVTPSPAPTLLAPPVANPTTNATYAAALAAYQVALTKYEADLVTYQAAVVTYKAALAANQDKRKAINSTFNVSLATARAAFQTFLAANPNATAAQKTAAVATRDTAIATANSVRTAALAAINPGAAPVKPVKPERPAKPEKAENTQKAAKPLKTDVKETKKS